MRPPSEEPPVLVEPERTPYDLNFRLFGFPVRVHPLFWLGAALLGANALEAGIQYLLVWIGVVFVSLLVHELGHALAFRAFGVPSHVVLYVFGGLAVPWTGVPVRWGRVLVALAGPVAGFVFAGLVYASNRLFPWAVNDRSVLLAVLFFQLLAVNVVWGLFNLLPVFPLDGGQVSQEVCGAVWRRTGTRVALWVSVVVAAAVAVYCVIGQLDRRGAGILPPGIPWWARGSLWTAILFGMLAVQSYQLLQQRRWTDSHWDDSDDRPPWRR